VYTENDLQVAFGKVIRKLRREAKLSQEELADRCNLHRTYISQLERGLKSPTLATIETLALTFRELPHLLIKAAEDMKDDS
jgi:transcriptional regulator with XRE-family HTH domain